MDDVIKQHVEALVRRFGTRDPKKIAKGLHIKVEERPLGSVRGYYIGAYREKMIRINSDLEPEQKRFTLSHELGHFTEHPNLNTPFLRENTLFSVDRLEVEAHKFAMCLCYSDDFLREEFDGRTVYEVAEALKVPEYLAEYRLSVME